MALPDGFRASTPSGISMMGLPVTRSMRRRTRGESMGRCSVSQVIGVGVRGTGLEGVEDGPEDVALGRERPDRLFLQRHRVAVAQGEVEALVRVGAGLGDAAAEVLEAV